MKIEPILAYFESVAPLSSAEEWDNVGLLCGSKDNEVTKVLLALDITSDVVREAKEKGCELILSHHPVIFDPLRRIEPDSAVELLIKYDIAALCLHTNLDKAENGVNTALAKALSLQDTALYSDDFLCIGTLLSPMTAEAFAQYIKAHIGSPSVRFTETGKPVYTVAVSSGGGGEGVELWEKYRFDAFVTGEIKHHQYLFAKEHGIAAFDAGHFSTEDVVIEPLKKALQTEFSDIRFMKSERCECPYRAV
ncbi:MAG: Nif3-like dinuclear metal center hexameric protein [Ruminococcus sp.]|nr:Nif3-like dinuclear metal center hexameric protein [Ruminococcus sp.]